MIRLLLSLFLLSAFICHAQDELHVHQINVENGEATLIGLYDNAQKKYTTKILIDGG